MFMPVPVFCVTSLQNEFVAGNFPIIMESTVIALKTMSYQRVGRLSM